MTRRVVFSLILALTLVAGGLLWVSEKVNGAAKMTLIAVKVNKAPVGLDDPVWKKGRRVLIPLEGKDNFSGKKKTVTTKAIYTDDEIYFLLTWKDATQSVTKSAWQFDGQKWFHLKGNEDRIALLFEITRIKNFASQGCTATCHGPYRHPASDYKFSTGTPGERGDLWHWKAARSAPYNYADDNWLTEHSDTTGRRYDAGTGGDMKNETLDKTKPLFMQNPTQKPSVPGFLLFEEAVKITDYSIFKAGDVIPFRLPKKPSGSRFDVRAVSRYADGGWVVMLYRKLNTGHEDDVIFNPLKKYSFALAVFDNSGDDHSKATIPMTLSFRR
jgi:hypothetical protein